MTGDLLNHKDESRKVLVGSNLLSELLKHFSWHVLKCFACSGFMDSSMICKILFA